MTLPLKIKLVLLGKNFNDFNLEKIRDHKSGIFTIISVEEIRENDIKTEEDGLQYSVDKLKKKIAEDVGFDIVFAVTRSMIEDNYYGHRLGKKSCIISYFDIKEDILKDGNTIENFILRNLYAVSTLYVKSNGSLLPGDWSYLHQDTRGCLFDYNVLKTDIIYSLHKPRLCNECVASMNASTIPHDYNTMLNRELSGIRRPLYYSVRRFFISHPIWSLTIASVFSLLINLLASLVYDFLKHTYHFFP